LRFEGNRRFLFVAAAVLMLLFAMGLVRDLLLEERTVQESPDVPPIIVEGLDVIREENGNDWHLSAERVEKKGDASEAEVLKVVIRSGSGAIWDIDSLRGTIFEVSGEILLYEVTGHIDHESGSLDWKAPRADWDPGRSLWVLPEGFEASKDAFVLTGERGGISMSGSVVVEEGAAVTWQGSAN